MSKASREFKGKRKALALSEWSRTELFHKFCARRVGSSAWHKKIKRANKRQLKMFAKIARDFDSIVTNGRNNYFGETRIRKSYNRWYK